ncbi:MAG: NADH-quinone oxidoreductase subunit J [Calditrichaeota bacterium]|nr:MAG: NADH-quinone oxidoreductase subunit J [Calditrichota bacterium]
MDILLNELAGRPVFWIISMIMLVSAFMVVTLKNVFHCAIFLILTLFSVAGLFVMLNAEFLAAAQVLIYVGAISILMIFAIMLSSNFAKDKIRMTSKNAIVVSLPVMFFGLGVIALVVKTIVDIQPLWNRDPADLTALPADNTMMIGKYLMTEYMLPFEVVSVLLLSAMIGAIVLARKERS